MKKALLIALVALLAPVAAQPLSPTDQSLSPERLARIQKGFPEKTIRDPFVIAGRPAPPNPPATPVAVPQESPSLPAPVPARPALPAPPPAVTVSGIVTSGSGNQALLKATLGTRLVKTGDRLGDLHVASIEVGCVTLTRGADAYRLHLPR